jgi:hypothetical protein
MFVSIDRLEGSRTLKPISTHNHTECVVGHLQVHRSNHHAHMIEHVGEHTIAMSPIALHLTKSFYVHRSLYPAAAKLDNSKGVDLRPNAVDEFAE